MQDTALTDEGAPVHDGYRVRIIPAPGRVKAIAGGVTVADSARVLIMHETRYAPVYYFPPEDVAFEYLMANDHRTHCPFKGNASYWSLQTPDRCLENAAWTYCNPFDESALVKDYVAFDRQAIDEWYHDGRLVEETTADSAPSQANPLVGWLVDQAWQPASIPELLMQFSTTLIDSGFPIWRARLLIQTMNPQLFALTYTWQRDVEGIAEFQATHAGLRTAQFRDSPFAAIIRGEGGIRRRLEGANPRIDYPILEDLAAEGATDYVAVPLRFSDGQINILVLVADTPGGFSTEQLAQLYEILANLSRILEAHSQRVSSLTLLQTYLGRNAGKRVMDGLIKRGDGEELRAVIWMSDLRGSTALAEQLIRDDYLDALNQYFDSVAGAIIEHGGEVLKFIGDAVLAIFTIDESSSASEGQACERALSAVRLAHRRMAEVNRDRQAKGLPSLRFGTGLHVGRLTYGNIGTPKRLDFTVIGPAVNETSRIEALCKEFGRPVIISQYFAKAAPMALLSLGSHHLRGVRDAQELFTLDQFETEGA